MKGQEKHRLGAATEICSAVSLRQDLALELLAFLHPRGLSALGRGGGACRLDSMEGIEGFLKDVPTTLSPSSFPSSHLVQDAARESHLDWEPLGPRG